MIELKDISISFDGNPILENLNLTVQKGEKVAIIGPSGSGKSTLLRLLIGLFKPDSGQIIIDGVNILDVSEKRLMQVRMKLGVLFQSAALFDSLNIEENVAFPLIQNTNLSSSEIYRRVDEKLKMVEMEGRQQDSPADLSGGQKKRIGLARALATDPEIVLYDEPTTGLDPILSTNIENLMVKLSDQLHMTSIIVTHQISTILRTADKIYLLHNKKLLPPETPDTVHNGSEEYRNFMRGGLL